MALFVIVFSGALLKLIFKAVPQNG